jgi:hypothetical protein
MTKGSMSAEMVMDFLDGFAYNAYQFLQHDIDPSTFYCYLMEREVGKDSALWLYEKYERFVYPFARSMSHLIRDVFDNDGHFKERISKEMYRS